MRSLAIGLLLVWVLSACGGPATEEQVRADLTGRVSEVRQAAQSGDYDRALRHLNELRSQALDLSRSNELAEEDFEQILQAALEVERSIPLSPPLPDPPAEPSPDAQQDEGDGGAGEGGQQLADPPASGRSSVGGSIRTGDGAPGRDGAPGQPGQDGEDGADGVDGRDT